MTVEKPESPADKNVDESSAETATGPNGQQIESAPLEADEFSVQELRAKLDEAEKRAIRFQADLENYRKRSQREAEDLARYATAPLLNGLLDVLDNLDRALEAANSDENAGALKQGVEMVAAQLMETLQGHGCQRIQTVGRPFDPKLHEAIQMQPDDQIPANHVMLEVQPGYLLHDRVLRPAKVMISTGPG